jgi:radical SAM superfamily enzyme YgiQ (UPF0313 family)
MTTQGPVRSAPRPLIEDLDALPFPARASLPLMRYFDATRLYPYMDIIGGRGCPYQCTFCQWPQLMFGHRYRFRSPQNIVDEIEHCLRLLPAMKWGEFFFEDDTFTVNKERAYAICEEIRRRSLRITWSINSRPDIYDAALFRAMKQAGCREFLVGFESGDQAILEGVKKGYTLDQARAFMAEAKKAGIEVHGCFVLGLPGETRVSARRSIEFALSLGVDTLQFSAAVPLPGSEYYEYCKREGLLKAKTWDAWLQGGEQGAIVDYPGLAAREINALVDEGLRRFYMRPSYMAQFVFRARNHLDAYRKLRGAWNLLAYSLGKR